MTICRQPLHLISLPLLTPCVTSVSKQRVIMLSAILGYQENNCNVKQALEMKVIILSQMLQTSKSFYKALGDGVFILTCATQSGACSACSCSAVSLWTTPVLYAISVLRLVLLWR